MNGDEQAVGIRQLGEVRSWQDEDEGRGVGQKIPGLGHAAQGHLIGDHLAEPPYDAWFDVAEAAEAGFRPDMRLQDVPEILGEQAVPRSGPELPQRARQGLGELEADAYRGLPFMVHVADRAEVTVDGQLLRD